MKKLIGAIALCCALGSAGQDEAPVRQMTVTQGPETVFGQPPAVILPALAGAKATGENGRVGQELVFWGYEHDNGRRVFFFACAQQLHFDCAARVPAICPVTTTVLETGEATGTMVRRHCREVSVTAPGELRPGCADYIESVGMDVGLVSCG